MGARSYSEWRDRILLRPIVLTILALAVMLVSAGQAGATGGAIIANGTVQLGVHNEGHLNVPLNPVPIPGPTVVGLRHLPTVAEGTAHGCLCEGWGAADATSGVTGYANESVGISNLTQVSFSSTGSSATSVVDVGTSIRVTHDYQPSLTTANLYTASVTIENISGGDIDARYRRVVDWDVDPTPMDEFITIDGGTSTALLFSSDDGFASPDPLAGPSSILFTGNAVDSGPADHGALFDFGFGTLAAGDSKTFNLYYGAASSEIGALAALAAVQAEVYSLAQPNVPGGLTTGSPNTFILGFSGVGGDPIGPALELSPPVATNIVGTPHTVTATVTNGGAPVAGVPVNFSVAGPNGPLGGIDVTDANGEATFTYTGMLTGTDTITAGAVVFGVPVGDTAQKTWIAPGPSLTLSPPAAINLVGSDHTVTATVTKNGVPVGGTKVRFAVTGPNGPLGDSELTNNGGQAFFTYTGNATGTDTITAAAEVNGSEIGATAEKTWVAIPHQGNIFPVAGGAPLPTEAVLNSPRGVARAADGTVYFSDTDRCRVMRVTPTGQMTRFAGMTDDCGYGGDGGPGVSASLNGPTGLAVDSSGNLYIADRLNHAVRRVTPGGVISGVAGNGSVGSCAPGSPATGACLNEPTGAWVDSGGNVFIADSLNHSLRRVSGGLIFTEAGNGTAGLCPDGSAATSSCLNVPWDVAGDNAGNVYVSSMLSHVVSRVAGGLIDTVAGDGTPGSCPDGSPATGACLDQPTGLDRDSSGTLYIVSGTRISSVSGGVINTVAGGNGPGYCGDGGPPTNACIDARGVIVDPAGRLFIADGGNDRVRLTDLGVIDTFAGLPAFCGDTGVAIATSCLDSPVGVAAAPNGDIYIADTINSRVRRVEFATGAITTVAGGGTGCAEPCSSTRSVLHRPEGVTIDPFTGDLYISEPSIHRVRRVRALGGASSSAVEGGEQMSTVAGNGTGGSCVEGVPATGPCLNEPRGLVLFGSNLYVGQSGGDGRMLRVDLAPQPALVYTAWNDGEESWEPTVDRRLGQLGNVYIAQRNAHRLLLVRAGANFIIDPTDVSTVLIGTGSPGAAYPPDLTPLSPPLSPPAQLNEPSSVQVDAEGHVLFSNSGTHTIHVIDPTDDGVVDGTSGDLVFRIGGGGTPTPGFCGDPDPNPHNAREACLNMPLGIAWDESNDVLYLADHLNLRVRKIPSDCDLDGLSDKAEEALGTDPCVTDTDLDGCADSEEVGPNQALGGRRDPLRFWDWMDVWIRNNLGVWERNKVVSGGDIGAVVARYGTSRGSVPTKQEALVEALLEPTALANYHTAFDRSGSIPGQDPWDLSPPDGVVSGGDIGVVVVQFGHSCLAPP
jgi:sugar lactone lactonase YvrE